MKKTKPQNSRLLAKRLYFIRFTTLFILAAGFAAFSVFRSSAAENFPAAPSFPPNFRVGERLTYNISFERYNDAGYAEIHVVSRGRIGDREAVELRSKIKTSDLVSAAFYFLNKSRTTFASAEKGLPLYVKKSENAVIMPRESISNFLVVPTLSYDLLTLIYQARGAGGSGTFSLQENDKIYNVSFVPAGSEKVKTDFGEFDTNFSNVQSEYLTEKGLTDLKINFSADEQKIPVLFRFKTAKGEFRGRLASVQMIEEETTAATAPPPLSVQTPRPTPAPTPVPTPTPYIENQPLPKELPFSLGETLDYQISNGGRVIGTARLQAKERKQFLGQDSLLLNALITDSVPGNRVFGMGDGIRANVSPDSVSPQQIEIKFTGDLSNFNQTTKFDQKNGAVMLNGVNRVEIPIGTHSLLSLIYAIRSYNLKPSKDSSNPVNDTRVAVFWDKQPYVFTLRPSTADIINLRGEKVSAQQISINTGNPQLDALALRLWLSNDERRLPLRLTIGNFQADLAADGGIQL